MKVVFEPTKGFTESYLVKFSYLNSSGFVARDSIRAYVVSSRKAHKEVKEAFKRKYKTVYKFLDILSISYE